MKVVSMAVGMTLFVFGAQLIFAILALLAQIIAGIGGSMLVRMDLLKVLWVGLSPLMAAGILTYIFKMVGLPNPLSIKGALDWGNHMGKGGGPAMFGGASSMLGRHENKVKGAAGNAASKAGGAVKGKLKSMGSGGAAAGTGTDRKGAAKPVGEKGAGVGGSAGLEPGEAALLASRALTKDEKAAQADREATHLEAAKAWAAEADPGSASILADSRGQKAMRGVAHSFKESGAGKVVGAVGSSVSKAKATAAIFQTQGVVAGAGHIARGTLNAGMSAVKNAPQNAATALQMAKTAPKAVAKNALVTAGVVTGAVILGPVAGIAAVAGLGVAAGAHGINKAYRAQSERSQATEAGVLTAYAAHQQREKQAEKSAAKSAKKAAKGVSPTVSSDSRTPNGGAGNAAPNTPRDTE